MELHDYLTYESIKAASPSALNIKNARGQTILHIVATQKNHKLLRLTILKGADPGIRNDVGNTVIHQICFLGDVKKANELMRPPTLKELSDIWPQKHMYSRNKLFSCLEYFNLSGLTALHIAVGSNNLKMVKLLLSYGANVNTKTIRSLYTPLYIAVENNNEEMVKRLLAWNADVSICTAWKIVIYELACNRDRSIQRLLERQIYLCHKE